MTISAPSRLTFIVPPKSVEPAAPVRPSEGPAADHLKLDDVVARAKASLRGTALADRLTPETLTALLQINADGTVATDASGFVKMKGDRPLTAEESLLVGAVRHEVWNASGTHDVVRLPNADEQSFFEHVTGHRRLEMGGGLFTLVDGDGVGVPSDSASWQLIGLLPAQREASGGEGVAEEWFLDWAAEYAKSGGIPADWLDRARAWFDENDPLATKSNETSQT